MGVHIDESILLDNQISHVIKKSRNGLRMLRKIRSLANDFKNAPCLAISTRARLSIKSLSKFMVILHFFSHSFQVGWIQPFDDGRRGVEDEVRAGRPRIYLLPTVLW